MGVQLDETEKRIVDLIEANRDEIIAFARDMYTHAELGYKEFKTAEKFTRLMKKLNLPVKEHLAVTGVKAYLNEEKKDNVSLALIGELDTLAFRNINTQIRKPRQPTAAVIMPRWQV